MEIRVLKYFLEVAREENITRAAEKLHISQPSLSRQLKDLEYELGKKLFKRGNYNIKLTDEGILLRKRAEEILGLVDKTTDEFKTLDKVTGGHIVIGCGESYLMKYVARVIKSFKEEYPDFTYTLVSGTTDIVTEKLDSGHFDIGILCETPNLSRYNYLELPEKDTWGLLVRKDHPLASKKFITVEDILEEELLCPEQCIKADIPRWCGELTDSLHFTGYTTLCYNPSIFVKEGLGCYLVFDKLVNTGPDSDLVFIPLHPKLENRMFIIWKKYQVFTPIAELFVEKLMEMLRK